MFQTQTTLIATRSDRMSPPGCRERGFRFPRAGATGKCIAVGDRKAQTLETQDKRKSQRKGDSSLEAQRSAGESKSNLQRVPRFTEANLTKRGVPEQASKNFRERKLRVAKKNGSSTRAKKKRLIKGAITIEFRHGTMGRETNAETKPRRVQPHQAFKGACDYRRCHHSRRKGSLGKLNEKRETVSMTLGNSRQRHTATNGRGKVRGCALTSQGQNTTGSAGA